MTTTNAELIATATAFKAAMSDANTDAPAPGSILDLWLRTADALEAATTNLDRVREARGNHPKCDRHDDEDAVSCGWKSAVLNIDAALTEGERR